MDKARTTLYRRRQHEVLATTIHAASHIVNYEFLEAKRELQETIDTLQRIIEALQEDAAKEDSESWI